MGTPGARAGQPASREAALAGLIEELEREAAQMRRSRKRHRFVYETLNWILGIPATGFAAAAGVSALNKASPTLASIVQ
jgi:hypothetical protein